MKIPRIVVIGPESTGKSTLSEALAKALHTCWVPEYAREYLVNLGRPYEERDLLVIARGQLAAEDMAVAQANKMLVCDTDLYVLKVWSESRYGRCDPYILEQIAARTYDLYLLTYIDVDWEDDPLREHSLQEERDYFFRVYQDLMENSNVPFAIVRGTQEERLGTALEAVRTHIIP